MEKERILNSAKLLKNNTSVFNFYAHQAELLNLIQLHAGKNNSFYDTALKIKITAPYAADYLDNLINSFIRSVEQDLLSKVSFERKIKIEVVNDYLIQAEELLDEEEFHPAVSAVLIGASLEEFLRNWVNDENLDYGHKATIDAYAKALKSKELITKQDYKEITVWGGHRNNAAHGHWELVSDHDKIRMMLAGVNIFIKQYS